MKLLKHNFKDGFAQVQAENLDDLWYLSQIIDIGDLVSGKTERKVKIGKGENVKVDRKVVFLKLKVENVEFAKHSAVLRVAGKIVDGPDDLPRGNFHTITVAPEERTVIGIEKQEWLNYQKIKLREACEDRGSDAMVACFDRESVTYALIKRYGFEIVSEYEGERKKKSNDEKVQKDFYEEIIKDLEEYRKRYKLRHIVLASPAFFKDDLYKRISLSELKKMITLATCSGTGSQGIAETLKRDEVKSVMENERTRKEMKVVEEILKEISVRGKVAYGIKEVEEKTAMGAVDRVAVTDKYIMKLRQEEKFQRLERVMKNVEHARGEVIIISSEHDGGRKLDGLGGVAALLRYKTEY